MGRIGPGLQNVTDKNGVLDIAVATTAVVYTKAFETKNGTDFALAYKASADGADKVKLKIEIEQGYAIPGTEGSADNNWAVPSGADTIEDSLAVKTQNVRALSSTRGFVVLPYARFKITGLGDADANSASTTIRMVLGKLEDV